MGPALQRLLARPSALKALKELVSSSDTYGQVAAISPCLGRHCRGSKNPTRGITVIADAYHDPYIEHDEPSYHPASPSFNLKKVPTSSSKCPNVVRYVEPHANNDVFSFERLEHESNVKEGVGVLRPRLVDTPQYRHNFHFWVELLEFRSRLFGNEGVADIWKGLISRDITLPVKGREADILWKTFLGWGFGDTVALYGIRDYALALQQRTGERWPALYETIIEHMLRTQPRQASGWHNQLQLDHPPRPGGLRALVRSACTSKQALHAFWSIYLKSEERDIYNTIIPLLCDRRQFDAAHKWHKLLIRKEDLPSCSTIVEPLMHYLTLYGKPDDLKELTHHMVDAGVPYATSTVKIFKDGAFFSRELVNRVLGDAHGIEPKTISDSFCARLFATRTFSVDTVLHGIRMLGVEAIGPLAMQAIASRDPTPVAFLNYIDHLKEMGFSIGGSTFTQSLRKAAIENKTQIFHDILYGDQHPDMLEDWRFQEATLAWALQHRQWREVYKTLAILRAYPSSAIEDSPLTWNLILRAQISRRNLAMVKQTLEEMRIRNVKVQMISAHYICQQLLRKRNRSKRPVSVLLSYDDLGLVVNLLVSVLRSGVDLLPGFWSEVLKRLGMTGRFQEFEKLARWLANWYNPALLGRSRRRIAPFRAAAVLREAEAMPNRLSAAHPRHPLRILFPTEMQSAIVAWSIRKAFTEGPSSHTFISRPRLGSGESGSGRGTPSATQMPWTRGLHLLKALKRCGVWVDTRHVRKVMKTRFRILYGKGRSKRVANRIAMKMNPFTIEEMAQSANQIWDNRLFASALGAPRGRWKGYIYRCRLQSQYLTCSNPETDLDQLPLTPENER